MYIHPFTPMTFTFIHFLIGQWEGLLPVAMGTAGSINAAYIESVIKTDGKTSTSV